MSKIKLVISTIFLIASTLHVAKPDIIPGSKEDKACGLMLGLAVGDAFGLKYERAWEPIFDIFTNEDRKLTDTTDDTANAIILAQSLLEQNGEFNDHDIIMKMHGWRYSGHYDPTKRCKGRGEEMERTIDYLYDNLKNGLYKNVEGLD